MKRARGASDRRSWRNRRPAIRQGLLPEISLADSPGASLISGPGSYANSATRRVLPPYFTESWSSSMYHCGLNRYPDTRSERTSMYFGLNIATHGAWSVTAWSAWDHSLLAADGSVIPTWPA